MFMNFLVVIYRCQTYFTDFSNCFSHVPAFPKH